MPHQIRSIACFVKPQIHPAPTFLIAWLILVSVCVGLHKIFDVNWRANDCNFENFPQ